MTNEIIRKRMQEVLTDKGTSVFAMTPISSLQQKLNNQINKETTISAETVMFFLSFFEDVSSDWLTRGLGDKYIESKKKVYEAESAPYINQPGAHDNAQHFGSGDINMGATGKKTMTKDEMLQTLLHQQQQIINLMKE